MGIKLENNYSVVDNILSNRVLTLLAPYAKHNVSSQYNRGIVVGNKVFKRGLSHEVTSVEEGVRFTLQLFVFDKREKTDDNKSAIWEIEK
jgi:hypothetical protein